MAADEFLKRAHEGGMLPLVPIHSEGGISLHYKPFFVNFVVE